MVQNAFIGKAGKPTNAELAAALGPAKALWDQLLSDLAEELQIADQEWSFYSLKAGWSLKLQRKKRNILYLSPCKDTFRVSFALGEKAVQAARASKLPQRVMRIIDEAKRFPEGAGVRLDVEGPKDLEVVRKLAKAKIGN